jgi:hypothetical protein
VVSQGEEGNAGTSQEPVSSEVDDDDDIAPTAIDNDPKARHAFAKVKAERKQMREENKRLREELDRLSKSQTPDLQEVLDLRKQIDSYETKLGQFDIASTRSFKERFDAPLNHAYKRCVSLLTMSGRDPETANSIVSKLTDAGMEPSAISDALADEPYALQGALLTLVNDYRDLQSTRQEAIEHWKETKAALGEQAVRDSEIKLMENIESDTGLAVAQALKEGNWMFGTSVSNEEWNKQVGTRVEAVKGIMRNAKRAELVKWVVEGITARPLRQMFLAAQKQNTALKAELDKMVTLSPKLGGASSPRAAATMVDTNTPRNTETIIDSIFDAPSRAVRR